MDITALMVLMGVMAAVVHSATYDLSVNWLAGLASAPPDGCTIPPTASSLPIAAPSCPPAPAGKVLTKDQYQALGRLLAPRLHMHPQEW